MSQVRSRLLGFAAVVSATSLALAACGSSSDSGSSSGSNPSGGPQLVSSDALTVCTHLSYKPFEFKDASGNVVGFDMDLAQNAAKQLGQSKVTIVDIDFASQTSGAVFAAKKCDMAMGAVTINDKRKQSVAFSTPYFSATQALLAKKSAGITDLSSLKGKKLGVQTDTTGQAYGDKNKDANGYETVVFDDLPTEIAGVQSGRVDAAINDNGPLLDFAKANPDFAVVKEFDTGEQYGFLFQKDNPNAAKIKDAFNAALKKSIEDGSYKASYKKWFGSEPAVMPSVP
ncbi:ABC transporter substrate-binding protein [Terrabacter sp. 2RAF25]|uniref:ABC transporter substrate-binding protein n=1 Tax=Terrabacter sp. 2RAF25 TaxID=3232998 RepID=UPI003F959A26